MSPTTHESLMRLAMKEAEQAKNEGNTPFGALLVDSEYRVVMSAHNTTRTETDPTAHAEINVIRALAQQLKTKDLSAYTLVCNAQSCAMCFSAALKAGITHFIYGYAADYSLKPKITIFDIQKKWDYPLDITTGILADECQQQIEKLP